jgi:alpha-tubulin suppressor-like RCC1 family protein
LTDGTAKCWGQNNNGNLGDGTLVPSHVPVDVVGLQGAIHLSAGMVNHTCATLDDGTAKCWGNNASDKLGVGPVGTRSSTALPILDDAGQPLVGILRIEAGNAHTCVALQANEVLCWGRNNNGQIGDGTTTTAAAPTAVQW